MAKRSRLRRTGVATWQSTRGNARGLDKRLNEIWREAGTLLRGGDLRASHTVLKQGKEILDDIWMGGPGLRPLTPAMMKVAKKHQKKLGEYAEELQLAQDRPAGARVRKSVTKGGAIKKKAKLSSHPLDVRGRELEAQLHAAAVKPTPGWRGPVGVLIETSGDAIVMPISYHVMRRKIEGLLEVSTLPSGNILVVDEEGLLKKRKTNMVASVIGGNKLVGPVFFVPKKFKKKAFN